MSTRAARLGVSPARKDEMRERQAQESEKRRLEAARMIESPAWKGAVEPLKERYLQALLKCPAKDDTLRYRLQVALECIETVEKHVISAHSHADFDAAKAIRADFGSKSWKNPFRR